MVLPDPPENPETAPELPVAVQVKDVPNTGEVSCIFVVWPEQTPGVVVP